MGAITALCFTLLVLGVVNSSVLPVEKCKLEDSRCLVSQTQKALPIFIAGVPDADIDVLDVMDMDNVKFNLAGFQFTLNEGKFKGLKNAVIDDVTWDLKKKQFTVEYHTDGTVKGHYTAGGQILILPITGDGRMTLKLKNFHLKLYIDYEMGKGADGKDHVKPTKFNFDFEVKDLAQFHMTNLFNGNKELSDAVLTFLNDNWKQVAVEFGRPLVQAAAEKLFRNIQKYFDKEAIENIAIV